jgi:hypothetical protein
MRKISIALLLATFAAFGDSCVIEPVKPVPPVGCKDLRAQCECTKNDDGTKTCRWRWICIKD